MEYSDSTLSDGPHVNIDSHGDIYLHKIDGTTERVGYVRGQQIYNLANSHLGYLGKDGHIYTWYDDCSVGRVE